MKTIGIIGGSGFIGSHTTKKFLQEGFKVRVSATDISKTEKYNHLKELPNSENLEILPLKVENKNQLKEFIKGCDIVVHGGTPFQLDVKDPKTELFDPTIEGTKNFLEVINKSPNIEKVVFIASVGAYNTNFPMPAGGKSPDDTFDEDDTPFMSEESHPYAQAKFIANQTVEKFINEHPTIHFEITSVSPTGVMGKSLSNREDSTSSDLQFLIKNKIAPNPFIQMLYDVDAEWALVDVKDIADGIYSASTKKGLHGKNYLLSSESWKISDVSAMLNEEKPIGNARIIYKNDAARKDLGIEFNPVVVPLTDFNN
ncbi:NAD-dependent epimerase/dehydratase family protein [Winogradskyella sp. UBA3174]|uniref:NAD-dependent epimerase/dehydratase family protein n=1 Tax=Winogradskyella sp. UBA3174 TaxID=1947785 RepID=UPI0025D9BDD3|nr:NAD-dependent epimerase/dehydratase family protein [Winogradskyella sp. UBA3174]|tara:strand:+ start:492 stop:1430 length:939 start_codon:yes stop_codon:yes gene_type:complete